MANERRTKLDVLDNFAPSPLILTGIVSPGVKASGCCSSKFEQEEFKKHIHATEL